jgi:pilus assembly protein CpaE
MAAPPVPEAAETIDIDDIKTILRLLRQEFDYVLVDTWSYLDDVVLAIMDLSDRVLLVMAPEIPSIKSAKQFFEVAEALDFPLNQIDLILNKVLPRDGIRAEQLENHINHKLLNQIDYDPKTIRQTTNQGLPLMMSEPNHPLAQQFLGLAQQEIELLEPPPAEEIEEEIPVPREQRRQRTGLFGRLKR